MENAVILEYEVEQREREVVIDYRVLNETAKTIYLFTPLSIANGDEAAPGRVYTFLDERDVLHVTKRLWFVPDDMDIYSPEVPRMTALPAGCEYTETLSLGLPIPISYPYMESDKSERRKRQSSGLALSIGYVKAEDVKDLPALEESRGDDESMAVDYETAANGQRLLEGEVLEFNVAVENS